MLVATSEWPRSSWTVRMSYPACSRCVAKRWRLCRYRHRRHYSESRDMPRQPCRCTRAASGRAGRTLGIFSVATLRGVTGDDHDSDIRGSVASGRGRVPGVSACVFRADAVSWVRACVVEERNTTGARFRDLARPARYLCSRRRGRVYRRLSR